MTMPRKHAACQAVNKTQPTCSSCDCVAGCQSRARLCPNLVEPRQQTETIVAYLTRHDDGDMLFFDKAEAQRYCDENSPPEPLVLLSAIAQPKQTSPATRVLRSLLGAALGALRYHTEQTRPIDRTKETIKAIERELFENEILAQPKQPAASITPDTSKVICPACVHQFRAIPQDVQRLMLDAGFEPPFTRASTIVQPEQQPERNFCARCGKRLTGDGIHTCTPPKDKP